MAQSAYNGRNRFDFESFADATMGRGPTSSPAMLAERFPGVLPEYRGGILRPEVIAPRGHRFGVSRLIVAVQNGTATLRRPTLSMPMWVVLLLLFFVYAGVVIRWFDQLGDASALWGSLTFTAFFVGLFVSHPRNDLMFSIDERDVTMRKGRGAEVTRATAEIQHCELAWVHSEGADGSSSDQHVFVVFEDGQRFDTAQFTEILRAVHWFRPDIALIDVPRTTQKAFPNVAVRPPNPGEDRPWQWYQEARDRREGDVSSFE